MWAVMVVLGIIWIVWRSRLAPERLLAYREYELDYLNAVRQTVFYGFKSIAKSFRYLRR